MKKLLLCMLVMLCCGVCWGNYDDGIRTTTETYKCSLCSNTTTYIYTYFEGERFTTYIVFHENLRIKNRAGYLGISLHKEGDFSWICPECLKQIIKALYKAGGN